MGSPSAPTSPASQFVADPTPTLQLGLNGTRISPASATSIVVFLSFITLATLVAAVICWIRRRRAKVSHERPLEKAPVCDVEALAATRPFVPVAPLQDVRWTPQIRSISGPAPGQALGRKPAPRRARSPPPSSLTKPRNLFLNPPPKSAPARSLSFSQNEVPYSEKGWGEELDPPVTPLALAVSGMQTRTLGKLGPKS